MGSRRRIQAFEQAVDRRDRLGEDERRFIEERDSIFQATVGTNGWPYVQQGAVSPASSESWTRRPSPMQTWRATASI